VGVGAQKSPKDEDEENNKKVYVLKPQTGLGPNPLKTAYHKIRN